MPATEYPQTKPGDAIEVGDVLGSHVPEFWDRDQRTVLAVRPEGGRWVAECGPGRFPVNLYASQLITITGIGSAEAVASMGNADTRSRTAAAAGTLTKTRPVGDGIDLVG
ncbi:MAG: hypothetical protein F4Z31_05290 [Gemmatimonadetes bacterium]|nr:hypothetical protein [Gemmatimonadota bacterium]MYF08817.1 hypothetical protein [Rhodospirillaceae bacterium]MYJ63680.1 hypothetical protein [Acidimicrobiia bacterium]